MSQAPSGDLAEVAGVGNSLKFDTSFRDTELSLLIGAILDIGAIQVVVSTNRRRRPRRHVAQKVVRVRSTAPRCSG